MEELKIISVEEFDKFALDTKTGMIVIPDGYTLVKNPAPEEIFAKEKIRLEEELKKYTEPKKEELIELGKLHHPYYMIQLDLLSFNIEIIKPK